jgi:ribosomal protein S18 acetylase RimI-like enzyme
MAACATHRPREPHATLHSLSVHPAASGRGVGTALVSRHLWRLDTEGLAAHLDSSNARNVPFYERLGFRVAAEVRVGSDGPVLRSLIRPPTS